MDGIAQVVPPFGAQSIAPSAVELTRFVDVERREVRMIALLHDTGVSAIYDIGERARDLGATTSPDEAVHQAFTYAGRAIVQTSVILAVGFAPMACSGYLSFRMIGILMPIAVLTALLADVLLLPALIRVGALPAGQGARQRSRGEG